jgi:hypothetical protein
MRTIIRCSRRSPGTRRSASLAWLAAASVLGISCGSESSGGPNPPPTAGVTLLTGDQQGGLPGQALAISPTVQLINSGQSVAAGEPVAWTVELGGGSVAADTVLTDASGQASVQWTLGAEVGGNSLRAVWPGHDSVTFHATGTGAFTTLGGGNNVGERYTSDLWVADGYAYSGSWGNRGTPGNAVKIWLLSGSGAPILQDSIITLNTGTISDIEVSADGKWLVFTSESGSAAGLHVYELTSPGQPVFRAAIGGVNLHTGTLATIGGKLYAFTAKDPANCALRIYDLSTAAAGTITQASATPIPDNYCIHDTFVRDGFAFVFAWNTGLYIFDVGNGSQGGSPANPVQISKTAGFGGETHNGWWFWNPTNGEKKYLFIGEEGPGSIGASSSGDIHVVDVSDFSNPVEVASYNLPGAGTHNFWIDEPKQVLYAAYYNGGVVALDISGALSGDLASREIARIRPGGAGNTYVWGVMLYGGSLYASDMISGLWQLGIP